ncbi:MAG: hypothetical protein EHM93_04905 [Bacteroidales bacterium]|nr:MAG: hypothetical protein EHM93_04905 [Bacteroidales bacterium]
MEKNFKFSLKKETITELTNDAQRQIIGGEFSDQPTCTPSICDCDNEDSNPRICDQSFYCPVETYCACQPSDRC